MKLDRKYLLAKLDTVYGVDPVPTGLANGMLVYDLDISPMEGQDLKRKYESATMGARGSIPVGIHSKVSFSVEATPSGDAGVAPAWDPLIRACACARTVVANTSVTYTRVSDNHEACSLYVGIDHIRYRMLGSRGNAVFRWDAQKGPMIDFSFTGIFTDPASVSVPPVDLGDQIDLEVQPFTTEYTPVFTINGLSLPVQKLSLDLGNQVKPRILVRGEAAIIDGFEEMIEATVEAPLLSTFNPYLLAKNQDLIPLAMTHGVGAGRITTLTMPRLQLARPGKPSGSEGVVEWPLKGMPLQDAGGDQFTLRLT